MSPTKTLATYAANLSYGEIPTAVTERMIDCVLDSLGAAIYGVSLPWSQALIGYARRYGGGGKSSIFASPGPASMPARPWFLPDSPWPKSWEQSARSF